MFLLILLIYIFAVLVDFAPDEKNVADRRCISRLRRIRVCLRYADRQDRSVVAGYLIDQIKAYDLFLGTVLKNIEFKVLKPCQDRRRLI